MAERSFWNLVAAIALGILGAKVLTVVLQAVAGLLLLAWEVVRG